MESALNTRGKCIQGTRTWWEGALMTRTHNERKSTTKDTHHADVGLSALMINRVHTSLRSEKFSDSTQT